MTLGLIAALLVFPGQCLATAYTGASLGGKSEGEGWKVLLFALLLMGMTYWMGLAWSPHPLNMWGDYILPLAGVIGLLMSLILLVWSKAPWKHLFLIGGAIIGMLLLTYARLTWLALI